MFKCAACDKVYKTRTSLTRHSHNHTTGTSTHTCGTCGVSFARRDILNRHVANGHCSSSNTARHRCHTACEPCRAARIRCNGDMPCRTCFSARKVCSYPAKTGRISHPTRPSEIQDDTAAQPGATFHVNGDFDSPIPTQQPFMPTSPATNHISQPENGHQTLPSIDASPGSADTERDLQVRPWPWLHENLFMQNGENAKCKRSSSSGQAPLGPLANGHHRSTSSAASEPGGATRSPLALVVENLVAYAANTAFNPDNVATRKRYWESASFQLCDIFYEPGSPLSEEPHRTLNSLVDIYLSNFNVLWPLLSFEQLDANVLHPVLFLTVSSIGAMFGHSVQRQYGTLMHERLRRLLSASLYDLEAPEGNDDGLVWLAQARLLTQVASLYFGQRQGFSYAQHLNAITIAQLRRMDYFREPIPDPISRSKFTTLTPEAELEHWQQAEARRRLAFGILRTDIYTSVLLSTRPILTPDEVKMTFPRSDELWLNSKLLSPQGRLWAQRSEDSQCLHIPFADLVRIFSERKEINPELGPVGLELTLFGLQEAVWKFSQDPTLFPRLTGKCLQGIDFAAVEHENGDTQPNGEVILPRAPPGHEYRQMEDLHTDRTRLLMALDSWSNAINDALAHNLFVNHKDTLMSSLLLYHLSRLRLSAPLEDLHHVSYRVADPKAIQHQLLRKVEAWRRSPYAPEAARQAWDVKTLIERELRKPTEEKARFNFLAFCSLHHAAVVLWTVAASGDVGSSRYPSNRFDVPRGDIENFLQGCPQMFSRLSPLGGNSFEAAAYRLSKHRFPQPHVHQSGG